MRFASYRTNNVTSYGAVVEDSIIDLGSVLESATLSDLIADKLKGVEEAVKNASTRLELSEVTLLPPIPQPGAMWCAGINTHSHFQEASARMGITELPKYPMFFLRAANTLVGSGSSIEKPALEPNFDYEGEIAVIIGRRGRNISHDDAMSHVAGYSCFNDGSARQYQIRGYQVTTGKNAYQSAGFGPWMVTADEFPPEAMTLETRVNDEVRQTMTIDDLIFSFADLISHISEVTWLEPGDVIVTGSAEGAGALRSPPLFLQHGDLVEVEVPGIGTLSNRVQEQQLG